MNVDIPFQITSDYKGYKYLTDLYHEIDQVKNESIVFNFYNNKWFEANIVAIFGAICESALKNNNEIAIKPDDFNAKSIFKRNGFLAKFGQPKVQDYNKTTITYKEFSPNQGTGFNNYIKEELLGKPDFPNVSHLLSKRMNQSIFEIYENARTHGKCETIFTCGQYYPNNKSPRIDTTIVDMGVSMKSNVNQYLDLHGKPRFRFGHEAIRWALKKGNTTKTGNISGGLGLDLVLEFLKLNKGKIQIVSSDGYWEFRDGETSEDTFSKQFPGTIVNIEVNIDDKKQYLLKEEVSFDDIF